MGEKRWIRRGPALLKIFYEVNTMRNRKVRLLSLLLATVMLLGLLAGCSSDGGEKKSVTKGGETVMLGADQQPIADGEHYELTFTVGYDFDV